MANNKAVFAKIPELKSGETVTLKFTATYEYKGAGSFSADDTLRNKAYVFYGKRDGDLDTSSKNKKVVVETNETVTKLPAFYGFEARGRGTDTQPDSIPTWVDETDIIDSAVPGDVVIFKTKIHNLGNGKDAFTLGIADDGFTFPKGTTFSFWDQTGAIALGNKTPEVAKGGQYILTIKAVLPPDAEAKKDKSKATLELASVGGGSGNNVALLLK
ncbi:MAG: hypothetical protein N0E48_10520, partial [Candidatus Thiodiazotropha endolucinida]|nr:hypothetical protein [Candidatus Thiodiazotropha taylori]MCW4343779.1 hypothetical protein [Candidatus Thiodiazotropha endolucinida]